MKLKDKECQKESLLVDKVRIRNLFFVESWYSHQFLCNLSSCYLRIGILNRVSLESRFLSSLLSHDPPNRWRKEAFTLREYDPITEYVPTKSIDIDEGNSLLDSLNTNLDGYIGPAYNYDDQLLTEDWMLNFQDSLVTRLSEDQFVRIQLENLLELMVNKVQDQVCNELGALCCEPIGLGSRLIEKPVWGIDSHTVKTIQLILEDFYLRNIHPSSLSDVGFNSGSISPHPNRFTIEEFKRYLERTLLPTINSIPTGSAHSMKSVLETIQVSPFFFLTSRPPGIE